MRHRLILTIAGGEGWGTSRGHGFASSVWQWSWWGWTHLDRHYCTVRYKHKKIVRSLDSHTAFMLAMFLLKRRNQSKCGTVNYLYITLPVWNLCMHTYIHTHETGWIQKHKHTHTRANPRVKCFYSHGERGRTWRLQGGEAAGTISEMRVRIYTNEASSCILNTLETFYIVTQINWKDTKLGKKI